MKRCQPRLLTPFLDGELGQDIHSQVEEHLRACPSCGALLDEVSIASQRIGAMGRSSVPAGALQRSASVFSERARLDPGRAVAVLDRPAATAELALEPDDPFTEDLGAGAYVEVPEAPPPPEVIAPAQIEARAAETEAMMAEALAAAPEAPPEPISFEQAAATLDVEVPPEPASPLSPPWLEPEQISDADIEASIRAVDRAMEEPPAEPANWPELDEKVAPPPPSPPQPDLAAAAPADPWSEAWTPPGREPQRVWDADPVPEPGFEATPEPAPLAAWSPAAVEPPTADEVAEAVRQMREQIDAGVDDEDDDEVAGRSRMPFRRPRPAMPAALPAPFDRLGVPGMVAGGVAIALVVTAVIVGATALARPRTASAPGTPRPAASSAPAAVVPSAPAVKPSAAATSNSGSLQLTGVSTAGSGGSGYQVTLIRSGIPSPGVFRLVFEISGAGAFPDVQLGKAADGSYYLISTGTSVDPAMVKNWTPKGPITSMTTTGGNGLNLKLVLSQPASYSIVYLSSPDRLVVDFK